MRKRIRNTSGFQCIAADTEDVPRISHWVSIFAGSALSDIVSLSRGAVLLGVLLMMLLGGINGLALPGEYTRMSDVRLLWNDENLLVIEGGMTIDADGAPRAYSPIPDEGLDALEHAGSPGQWDGIATHKGEPIVQGPDDPAPGYYVSTTALQDFAYPFYRQDRYVDASRVPYIALPMTDNGPQLGDLALVINTRKHKASPAVFADISSVPGEGSIALARHLGIHADARRGGTDGGVLYFVFNNSGTGALPDPDEMATKVEELWKSSAVQEVWKALCSEHPDWSCGDIAFDGDWQSPNAAPRIQEAP